MELDDNELIRRAQAGNKHAFETLFHRYKERIYNYTFRFLGSVQMAEEVTQNTFIVLYRNLNRYKASASAGPWIYKMARNLASSAYRTSKLKSQTMSLDQSIDDESEKTLHDLLETNDVSPSEALRRKEFHEQIQKLINGLPEKYREVLILHDVEGLSYEKIQTILNIPYNTAVSRSATARLLIRKKIDPKRIDIQLFFMILFGDNP